MISGSRKGWGTARDRNSTTKTRCEYGAGAVREYQLLLPRGSLSLAFLTDISSFEAGAWVEEREGFNFGGRRGPLISSRFVFEAIVLS